MEKTRLENFVSSFQINNDTCIKIKQIVKQEIESIISNPRRLLRLSLISISNRQGNTLENSRPCIITHLPIYRWNKYYQSVRMQACMDTMKMRMRNGF